MEEDELSGGKRNSVRESLQYVEGSSIVTAEWQKDKEEWRGMGP